MTCDMEYKILFTHDRWPAFFRWVKCPMGRASIRVKCPTMWSWTGSNARGLPGGDDRAWNWLIHKWSWKIYYSRLYSVMTQPTIQPPPLTLLNSVQYCSACPLNSLHDISKIENINCPLYRWILLSFFELLSCHHAWPHIFSPCVLLAFLRKLVCRTEQCKTESRSDQMFGSNPIGTSGTGRV